MVANRFLDVMLAVPCDLDRKPIRDDSIFHEKTGIIEDKTGDRLAFNGSINETEFGWTRNWESFNAFTSWNDGPRVDGEEASFAKLWADKALRAITLDVPTALREQLLKFLPDPEKLPKRLAEHEENYPQAVARKVPPDPFERKSGATAARGAFQSTKKGKPSGRRLQTLRSSRSAVIVSARPPPQSFPGRIKLGLSAPLRQLAPEAADRRRSGAWKNHPSGLAATPGLVGGENQAHLDPCPKNVCRQWQIELREKFNLNWPIYDGQKLTWYRSPARDHDFEKPVSRSNGIMSLS